MGRKRSEKREVAKNMWLTSKGKMKLKDIAKKLEIKEQQVRKWKSEDKWVLGEAVIAKPKKKTGPKPGTKNALKTGVYEKIFFEDLSDNEITLVSSIGNDKIKMLEKELALLTVREYRIMKRMEDVKNRQTVLYGVQQRKSKDSSGTLQSDDLITENMSQFEALNKLEEALTKIQDKKIKTIETISKIEIAEARLSIEKGENTADTDTISNWLEATKPNGDDVKELFAVEVEYGEVH